MHHIVDKWCFMSMYWWHYIIEMIAHPIPVAAVGVSILATRGIDISMALFATNYNSSMLVRWLPFAEEPNPLAETLGLGVALTCLLLSRGFRHIPTVMRSLILVISWAAPLPSTPITTSQEALCGLYQKRKRKQFHVRFAVHPTSKRSLNY